MHNNKIQAVLFDLDGTLVDTAKDFVRIIHELAEENNWQAPSEDIIRQQVSAGSQAMVSLFRLGNEDVSNEQLLKLKQQFLERYEADICIKSSLFEGLNELLKDLKKNNIPWGIVTNKPRYLSEKLLAKLKLNESCGTLVCPDDVTNAKPDPEPIYLAMKTLGLTKAEGNSVIYIGDHIRDIQSGNAADNITILAGYGYISSEEYMNLNQWNANYTVETSDSLAYLVMNIIKKVNQQ